MRAWQRLASPSTLTMPTVDVLIVLIGIRLIRLGRGGTGEVIDLVDFQKDGPHDVVPDQLEVRTGEQLLDVVAAAREEIVEAQHVVAARDQPVAEVAADKARTAGDKNRSHSLIQKSPNDQRQARMMNFK